MSRRLARCALAAGLALGCATTPAWEMPPPPIQEGPVVPQDRVHRTILENWLELLVLEDPRTPRLAIGLALRRGADVETLEEAGSVVLLTDVMERGAGRRDALALARAIEDIGGSLSAGADFDSLTVGVSGLTEDADLLYELLADVALRPRLEPTEVARARAEQLAGLERDEDRPAALLWREIARTLYDGHRYGAPTDGVPETVARIDARDLRALHARLFTPRNAIFYAVGDVAPEDVVQRVREHFGAWDGGAPPPPPPVPSNPTPEERRVVIVDRPDLAQAQLALAHEGIARSDPGRIPATLMNTVLGGGGFLSRLLTRVRAEEGLAYSIGSGFAMRRAPGPFAISTSTRVSEAGRVVEIALAELERMKRDAATEAELGLVKSFSAGRFVLGLETPTAIAASLVELDVQGLPRDSLDTFRTRVNETTTADLAEAARERLHPDRIAIVAVGPAEVLRPQLDRFGPVEVVKP